MRKKNYIPILLLISFCSSSFAQTKKGNFVLSGKTDLNFLFSNTAIVKDSIKIGSVKGNQYGLTGGLGYFLADNFSVGISGTYFYKYSKIESGTIQPFITENITQGFSILPQLNYYFPMEGKLKPSVGIGAGYLWVQERDSRISDNNNTVYSLSGTSFTGGAGLSYFISRSVAFDLGAQFSHNRLKNKIKEGVIQKENVVAGRLGVSVFF